ncbi:MAG: isoleucine--tRNA ligase [Gemmataceae bacterium]
MPFAKVETQQVDFPAQERAVLEFWDKIRAFDQLRAKNAGKPKWSFLDGPITANNPMGVHHAWGRTYKDAYQRYFAMTGREERYQNGFDCQGLWVEVEVEKELKLQSKRDIENLVAGDRFASIDKFVSECKARVDKFARVQTEQSIRLGMWMNWDRTDADWAKPPDERKSYFTMSEENNYTIWGFLKKCHDRGLVYRGYDSMPWCPRCGVGISQMEMHEGYRLVAHTSVFVKFPLRKRDEPEALATRVPENLLVWTTTPWTLSSNVAAAVNPELTYLKIKHRDEYYYVAKGAYTFKRKEEEFKHKEWLEGVPKLKPLEQIFKEKGGGEIVEELKGSELVGWEYDGPFDELPAQAHAYGFPEELADVVKKQGWATAVDAKHAHRVIAWQAVGETEGTGIVHIAPGCGKEDFQLGKEWRLPPVAPLDEYGAFLPGFGELTGKSAVDPKTAEWILFNLQQKNRLFASEKYPHTYPHCWRCKTELLFRLVDEWFIAMSWRKEIMRVVEQATFLPESINGKAREQDWLKNMGDWMISKKRYWGLALPIWVDEVTGEFEVIGSRAELKSRAVEGWAEFDGHSPHRPWIDKVKIRNPKTGNLMSRVPDVGNPWLDAGIVPYSTMCYNRDRASWEEWFPADFITESFPGQFRNWFYAILAMSTMMTQRPPFKVLLGHGQVRDQNGEEMHKSKGNAIEFNGAADSGYELFHERNPKLSPEAQAKLDQSKGGLPEGYLRLREGEKVIEGKKVQALIGEYKPIGADVIRWLYCRTNPSANVNIGPGPADELRSKFVLKLWNSYAFFCNYAALDRFDPAAAAVPVAERPDIDRWILSDLQLLIRTARAAFERYDVMAFCVEAEKFVDDKLSNWYIRRNRRRFWKGEKGSDKDAAYQTLYTMLATLTKLLAPVVPFLTETMFQNLRLPADPASVHLCDYPQADASLIDQALTDEMDALLGLVALGSAARNIVKIKVRQPLAELKVQGTETEKRAVERFADQLCDELNVREVSWHEPEWGMLLSAQVKVNMKSLAPKVGPHLQEVKAAVEQLDPYGLKFPLEMKLPGGVFTLDSADVTLMYQAEPGWVGVAEHGAQVALDTRITPELKLAGLAREVVRLVQDLRKKASLEMEDRIALWLSTQSPELQQAILTHKDYIAAETLTVEWLDQVPADGVAEEAKVDGKPLSIALQKMEAV